MLFAGEVLWGEPGNPSGPDYTDAGVAKDLIDTLYVPERFFIEKLYEAQGNLSYPSFMNALSQGKNIINVLCHGQYKTISLGEDYVSDGDFSMLTNGPRYGLFYSATCYSGGFDQDDCIGEVWVLSPDGGGFFIGNSRYGWNCPGFAGEGPSDYYDQSFFESIFVTGFTHVGKAHTDAKHEFVAESRTDDYMLYLMYGLNLLGDPEMRLWTEEPDSMQVSLSEPGGLGSQVFEVDVTSKGTPVPGATVCLFKSDEVYIVDETDEAGQVSTVIEPASEGTLLVTVTKQDFIPFVGEIGIVEEQGETAVPEDFSMDRGVTVQPNPFTSSVRFEFPAASGSGARIEVFDIRGRSVGELRPELLPDGGWGCRWDVEEVSAKELPPGIYLVRFTCGSQSLTRKVIRLR
jgi:hypothetical protein